MLGAALAYFRRNDSRHSEGRESGGRREAELRVQTGEALVGVRARWQPGESTKGGEESGEEEYAEKLWPAIVLE